MLLPASDIVAVCEFLTEIGVLPNGKPYLKGIIGSKQLTVGDPFPGETLASVAGKLALGAVSRDPDGDPMRLDCTRDNTGSRTGGGGPITDEVLNAYIATGRPGVRVCARPIRCAVAGPRVRKTRRLDRACPARGA